MGRSNGCLKKPAAFLKCGVRARVLHSTAKVCLMLHLGDIFFCGCIFALHLTLQLAQELLSVGVRAMLGSLEGLVRLF